MQYSQQCVCGGGGASSVELCYSKLVYYKSLDTVESLYNGTFYKDSLFVTPCLVGTDVCMYTVVMLVTTENLL